MASPRDLLEMYKPRLVVFSQNPQLHRPWNRIFERVAGARGDYHPCPAEFFLSFVFQRSKPGSWFQSFFFNPKSEKATGLEELKRRAFEGAGSTQDWEMDLVPISVQAFTGKDVTTAGQMLSTQVVGTIAFN